MSSTAEKRTEARRMVQVLDKSLPGPVTSLWVSTLHRTSSSSGMRSDVSGAQQTRFCTTQTEDAMDSILPCAAEEWLRVFNRHNQFGNAAKLKFRYSAH